MRAPSLAIALVSALATTPAAAQFARPPGDGGGTIASGSSGSFFDSDGYDSASWRREHLSWFRLHVGGAGRLASDGLTPGMLTALDFGRGPAGFRASAAWLRVGSDDGLAQYTGELTLDLGGRSRWRPIVGAGAGLARTYRVDDTGARTSGGSSLGIGVLRLALEYRLPLEDVDARVGAHAIGTLPAIRGDNAPDLDPWLIGALTIGVGF
jgi:hypothetical protein